LHKLLIAIGLLFFVSIGRSQNQTPQQKQINIVYGANFTKDEAKYPGASIFSKDDRQVQFEHQGAVLFCDVAIFYQKENKLKAINNVRLQQGDSITMTSGKIDYNGNLKLAKAYENVVLTNTDMTLKTDTLRFDREKQEAYYQDFGTVVDSANTLTSEVGKYYMVTKKYQFLESVNIKNPEYTIDSKQLDYYTTSKNAYMYGPSTITGKAYKIYCERGYYDTRIESGYGIKNTRIDYNNRIIEGDSVYFDKRTEFASATNNIKITDTINKGILRAHYAEVYKAKDSVFATRRAVSISEVQNDSLYMHGDTLMITGKPDERILRAFRNAKFYKTDLSGKSDSIHFDQKTGITQLITKPVIWNGENQMTGDSIHLLSDLKTEKLDSLKVLNNAFVISLDSISKEGYNQAKGINLYGKFEDNQLKIIDLVQNTEVIYYMYNDDQELIGINKTTCSAINIVLENNEISDITFITNPEGDVNPEKELPINSRKLKGFIWRGDERIRTKDDIFDEDDNNLTLVKINGIDNPIDTDAPSETEEPKKSKTASDIAKKPVMTGQKEKESKIVQNKDKEKVTTQKKIEEKDTIPVAVDQKTKGLYDDVASNDGLFPGYYLVANVFEYQENYKRFMQILSEQGLEPKWFFRKINQYNYVYLARYDTKEEAVKARETKFFGQYPDETWILRVVAQ
jgi:lipopolysaccharide export system protein LptA